MLERKILIFCLLVLFGAALFVYGAFFHSTKILPKQEQDSTILVYSEPALIKEVTISGVKRNDSGQIRKTYDKTPPKSCAT